MTTRSTTKRRSKVGMIARSRKLLLFCSEFIRVLHTIKSIMYQYHFGKKFKTSSTALKNGLLLMAPYVAIIYLFTEQENITPEPGYC